ncbi:hypothetical protein [Rhodococcus sp. HNM0569]|nr:hypothetical protein [Rhodococcus sp. HNM0569]NLU84322.1 hypothetical protein [Rhodococcus sp. HNM0569]
MGKLKDAMHRMHIGRRDKTKQQPAQKQLDRWANEGGAVPPEDEDHRPRS